MKKILFSVCLLPILAMSQNKYIVNNSPGATADFTSLQTAVNTVAAGSSLYVMPGVFSYGDVVVTKNITIYGTGYFLGQNLEPSTQANPTSAKVNSLWFKPGSALSYVEGLQIAVETGTVPAVLIDTVSNITVTRCLIISTANNASSIVLRGAINCTVKNCYISPPNFIWNHPVLAGGDFSGIQFNNNIIFNNGGQFYANASSGNGTASFKNNTISSVFANATFGSFNYTNNIFISQDPPGNFATNLFNGANLNNITNATNFFSPVGKQIVEDLAQLLFVSRKDCA